jgi:hypothetical protein
VYLINQSPTESYHERHALLVREARNARQRTASDSLEERRAGPRGAGGGSPLGRVQVHRQHRREDRPPGWTDRRVRRRIHGLSASGGNSFWHRSAALGPRTGCSARYSMGAEAAKAEAAKAARAEAAEAEDNFRHGTPARRGCAGGAPGNRPPPGRTPRRVGSRC